MQEHHSSISTNPIQTEHNSSIIMKEKSNINKSLTQYPRGASVSHSQSGCHEPHPDALIGFSDYNHNFNERGADLSSISSPASLQRIIKIPGHDHNIYCDDTGISSATTRTLAVNHQPHQRVLTSEIEGDENLNDLKPISTCDSAYNSSDIDMEFDSPNRGPKFYYPQPLTMALTEPSFSNNQPSSLIPIKDSNLCHYGLNLHQQLANDDLQQRNHSIIQSSRQTIDTKTSSHKAPSSRMKVISPSKDVIVEEKISQLLKSMRQGNIGADESKDHVASSLFSRSLSKKDEEMDEDEKLLVSEEGKKLSSKERRQLRNKVSARAFRSRRKEYINQLEDEITVRINENGDLRAQNQALIEENIRLSDITRMLISSPSLSGFVDSIAMNPVLDLDLQAYQQPSLKPDLSQPQPTKDVNPNIFQQQNQQPYFDMTSKPEAPLDFSVVDYNYDESHICQPQVFFVEILPEIFLDSGCLSLKTIPPSAMSFTKDEFDLPQIDYSSSLNLNGAEEILFGDEKSSKKSIFTFFDINPLLKSSQCRPDFPQLATSPIDQSKILKYTEIKYEESDAAILQKIDRLVAETDACYQRLSTLVRNR
ncbi:BZIP-type transcription factor MBZ1 [Golovinomyces cichoracearum]|uniref:BZIP-type transcription factor MBZ1 n=1 Tax=Golovinomyces cichoracearum TaxID=62708 RepID=A0A420IAT2_9PEZI|nr:BZIP-type transcription factor MBZ1 [Golovinomyces cichoracearum]